MGNVKESGRLVQQQKRCLLCKCHCDPHALALTTRQGLDTSGGEFKGAGGFQRFDEAYSSSE